MNHPKLITLAKALKQILQPYDFFGSLHGGHQLPAATDAEAEPS